MRIFMIHSGSDYQRIMSLKEIIRSKNSYVDILALESNSNYINWKKEARVKIKQSDLILYALGENSSNSKNIDYELKYAIKYKRQILLYRLNKENNPINSVLYVDDKFMSSRNSSSKRPLFKEISLIDLDNILKNGYDFDIRTVLDLTKDPKRESDIIEQYKVYLETSEQILNRRQNVSNFYTTLNTSLLTLGTTATGIIFGLESINNNKIIALLLFFIISIIGIILCYNWLSLLESYGRLNSSKIKVICEIEKRLPVNIYDTEWKVMSEKMGDKRYLAFTTIEKRVPKMFILIYGLILIISIILFII